MSAAVPTLDELEAGADALDAAEKADTAKKAEAFAGLTLHILRLARIARDKPVRAWPAWSTGEWLMVGLVLNKQEALAELGYTTLEAIERVDLDVVTLRAIERRVHE